MTRRHVANGWFSQHLFSETDLVCLCRGVLLRTEQLPSTDLAKGFCHFGKELLKAIHRTHP